MVAFNKATIPPIQNVLKDFEKILESGVVTNNGPVVREFERQLAQSIGSRFALTTANGTLALHLAVRGLELRGEIITTPLTFIASSSCIIWEGCTPVFADVDPETLCLDVESVRKKINERTVGILPVHLYGNTCDMDGMEELAEANGLKTIYDGAQAFGTKYKGRAAVSMGSVTMLSLHAYKVVSAVEGGALFTEDEQVYENLFRLRYFGKKADNTEVMLGINAKMSELNAAYGLATLAAADQEIAARKKNYDRYRMELIDVEGLSFQKISEVVDWNYAYMPVILPSEEALLEVLDQCRSTGVQMKRYFYPAVNAFPFLDFDPQETPLSYDLSKRILCLPNYASLKESDLLQVADVLKETLK